MRYVAAYLLLSQSGNKPSADDVKNFLTGLEVEVDEKALGLFFEKLGESDVADLLEAGAKKLCSGGGGAGGAAAAGGAAGGDGAAAEEEKEEEEEEEEEEVALGGIVGGDDDGW